MPTPASITQDPRSSISVIIPTYRPERKLGDCISSVIRSGEGLDMEILIIDSSEDDIGPLVADHLQDNRVRLVKSQRRLFPGEARDLGVGMSGGEIVAFTDSDCIAAEDWLPALVEFLVFRNGAACGGAIENGTPGSYFGTAEYLSEFGAFTPRNASRRGERFVPSSNMALHKAIYLEAGGFPAEQEKGSDVAFGARLREIGKDIAFLNSAVVIHLNRTKARDFIVNQYRLGKGFAANTLAGNQPFSANADNAVRGTFLLLLVFPGRLYRIVSRALMNGEASPLRMLYYLPGLTAGALVFSAGCAVSFVRERRKRGAGSGR